VEVSEYPLLLVGQISNPWADPQKTISGYQDKELLQLLLRQLQTGQGYWHVPPGPLQNPLQHWALVPHDAPGSWQVAACAGVGATIEVTSGTATIAASPKVRTICRLFMPAIMNAGGAICFSRRLSLENWSTAYHTSFSSIAVSRSSDKALQAAKMVVSPSQYFQIFAAVWFRQ
jgi:hypothetical protein